MASGGIELADPQQEEAAAAAQKHAVYFVLEEANLEVAKVGKNYELLNCDDHASFLRKHGKDVAHYRPDITHQVPTPHTIRWLLPVPFLVSLFTPFSSLTHFQC